ncbi:SHC SH2 domain-binding protein 1 [Latimeria chalumnae]|uniref:SHC SH2 domain-binding protein 1 n=1 Tax=Latimeria chalumnae TaxID=7897 RepID=UPI00313DAB5C
MKGDPRMETLQDTENPIPPLHFPAEDLKQGLFQDEDDSSDYGSHDKPGTALTRLILDGNVPFPDIFETNRLLFYERFKAYQDYMLGDCKASEVKAFTVDYLEKVIEPSGWQAVWQTDLFKVLVEVTDVEYLSLKAVVELMEPVLCESRVCSLTDESVKSILEAKDNQVPLQDLDAVYDESGEFDQTALAIEHVRFFYKNIWRKWDEEDEDDDFDYFVRCVEPRLRLYYDILEDRVPSGLVAEYYNLLSRCEEKYKEFTDLRNTISNSDSESELDNISMVEGLKMYEDMETLKRKLKLIENPLLRYVLGYQAHSSLQINKPKGLRPTGEKVIHIVSISMTVSLLQSLMRDKLYPASSNREFEIQFYSDPLAAVNACYEGDTVVICPGHYSVNGFLSIADSIVLEGYGLPDDVVIEKQGKGDTFIDCIGATVNVSNMKFVQHDAVEGILCVRQGKTVMENCVFQCETTGVTVRTPAELYMKNCDLYGAKGAGVEIYPGSTCRLTGNGIHHCKEGILIKDFIDEVYDIPRITMTNNVIHNNEGYGVILVKPRFFSEIKKIPVAAGPQGNYLNSESDSVEEQKVEVNPSTEATKAFPGIEAEEYNTDRDEQAACIDPSQQIEGNDAITSELVAASAKKSQVYKKRLSELGVTKSDDNLMSQEMFVSILGNQFKRNGKGSFGTFFY